MFLDSMQIPLSIESIHIYLDESGTHIRFINHEKKETLLVLLVDTVHRKPSNLNGHNFFVRTPFQMFLNSMESPLSLKSISI